MEKYLTAKKYLDLGIKLTMEEDFENAITAFCAAIKLNSKYAAAYNNLGLVLKKTRRLQEAEACFCRAIELKPSDSYAYNNLGLVLMDLGDLQKSEACFRKAIQIRPNQGEIYSNLGTILEQTNQFAEAKTAYYQAVELNPNYPEAHYNLGTFLRVTKQMEDAERYLRQAVALRSDYWEADLALANLYLLQGNFSSGWEKFEKLRQKRCGDTYFTTPKWNGEDLTGRSILLYWEYGFGDTIQFIRYAQKVEKLAAKTSIWVQKPLERLSSVAFPNSTVYSGECPRQDAYDYVCSLLSLPVIFNTCNATVPQPAPYRLASQAISADWHNLLAKTDKGTDYRVGVVWAGHPKHLNNSRRSIPFHVFRNLLSVPEINWISLQVGLRAEDLAETTYHVTDVSNSITDFMDTAGLIETLDLVITVDTSVAHLAGTMGKKTWVLLPFDPDWRWQLARDDSPWYSAIKLFRQRRPGDWREVIGRVKMALLEERSNSIPS
ncbi:MAG: Tetratricopeptide repeat-containing protein [Firmicutes bacterium]|nr:Tetratricopeptide repeat-containing protein [Bacillota bacterium]